MSEIKPVQGSGRGLHPRNPHKYQVGFLGKHVHHIRELASPIIEAYCGDFNFWLEMWITQEQLDAMPSEAWCRACLREIS